MEQIVGVGDEQYLNTIVILLVFCIVTMGNYSPLVYCVCLYRVGLSITVEATVESLCCCMVTHNNYNNVILDSVDANFLNITIIIGILHV